jgi:hypothetical protein
MGSRYLRGNPSSFADRGPERDLDSSDTRRAGRSDGHIVAFSSPRG